MTSNPLRLHANGTAPDHPTADAVATQREILIQELRDRRMIVSDAVEAAFRTVPREAFMPAGTALNVAYGYDEAVTTAYDEHGRAVSSVSAAYIQAAMLEQAMLKPGMRVLEVGSGGLNAAYLSEIVGPDGRVVSVDIDPAVIDRATRTLDAAGYAGRARLVTIDAEHGVPDEEPFDAILVTVGAWDIAPAWLDQLAVGGIIVLPFIMNGITLTIAFRRDGDRLVSTSTEAAGFVPMRGDGARDDRVFDLPGPNGQMVHLAFDAMAPKDPGLLDGALATDRAEAWSGVTVANGESFLGLHLWWAWTLDGFCRFVADDGTDLAAERGSWFPFGVVRDGGFAYLVVRPRTGGGGAEFGARAYGRDGQQAADVLVASVRDWDAAGRPADPTFTYWPGSDRSDIPTDAVSLTKRHGVLTISWA